MFARSSPLLVAIGALVACGGRGGAPPAIEPGAPTTSHLGARGPAYWPGATPEKLGWGANERAYPDRLAVNPKDGAELGWVPPGEFEMGSSRAGPEEQPVHRVRLTRGYWMYRHPVTNAQYRLMHPTHTSGDYEGVPLDAELYPVVQVNWTEAMAYAAWAEMTLPTEAQWEYAGRAGTTGRFYWGESEREAGKYANVGDFRAKRQWLWWRVFETDDGYVATSPVGSYAPNAFGLYDMIGNVWEWCADWHAADYYAKSPAVDPPGPSTGKFRVNRGGSWDCYPDHSTVSYRNWLIEPHERFAWLGFRPVSP